MVIKIPLRWVKVKRFYFHFIAFLFPISEIIDPIFWIPINKNRTHEHRKIYKQNKWSHDRFISYSIWWALEALCKKKNY